MPKPTPSAPVELKLKDLEIDYSLSGRSKKEITTHSKQLAPAMRAHGGWDHTQPGAFFERDGKKHLARGFTRVAAAEDEGIKAGWFFEIPDDPAKLRTEAIRSNMGKPISAYEQGRIYAAMRDGSSAEDAKPGEVVLEPMKVQAIADEVGYSGAHITKCIAIFESPEQVALLLEMDLVSANVVYAAAKLAKNKESGKVDEGKQLRIVKAAIAAAKEDGKDTATEKHFNAIKDQFAPPLKAAESGKPTKPKKGKKDDEGGDEPDSGENREDEAPEATRDPASQGSMDLGGFETPSPKPPTKKQLKTMAESLVKILEDVALHTDPPGVLNENNVGDWAKRLMDAGVTVPVSPI